MDPLTIVGIVGSPVISAVGIYVLVRHNSKQDRKDNETKTEAQRAKISSEIKEEAENLEKNINEKFNGMCGLLTINKENFDHHVRMSEKDMQSVADDIKAIQGKLVDISEKTVLNTHDIPELKTGLEAVKKMVYGLDMVASLGLKKEE
ncbi:hypothetical protein [Serratia sp. (in: enterobacteria)]|uniref:hypothetical protein n=1 Tax=Serratia sp. (in: enterobacteria) TaxID=616 RepID=UPI003989584D